MHESQSAVDLKRGVLPATALFSAVLLAGGKSSRMGCDKAALQVNGKPLWERQWDILQRLGIENVYLSGRPDGPWRREYIPIIEDETPEQGPMGALISALRKIPTKLLVVLAVDMPMMTAEFLQSLMQAQCAIIPKNGDYYEPLAAVYSRAGLIEMETLLQRGERSLQTYLQRSVTKGSTVVRPIQQEERAFFANANTPNDRLKHASFKLGRQDIV